MAVIFVSNGPGELTTWVRPLAENLHRRLSMRPRNINSKISLKLILVPCPNATGKEKIAASRWSQFEQIFPAENFWKLLFRPKKFGLFPKKGVVVFLGGDQFWSVLISSLINPG